MSLNGLSLNDISQNVNIRNNLLAHRTIPSTRKIIREPSDYEKSSNQKEQQTIGIIESM
jgi:hypothetical protein